MRRGALAVRPLSAATGVEVLDLDLSAPLDPDVAVELGTLLDQYRLLLFRSQTLEDADHVRVMSSLGLGPVLDETFDGSRVGFVSNVSEGAFVPEGPLLFHSDLAFCPEPLVANSLYAMVVPSDGAPTRFADAERAAATLPSALRRRVEGRSALQLHDLRSQRSDRRFRQSWVPADQPRASHPVLWAHPRTGREVLYVTELQTDSIVGLDPAAGDDLLGSLFAHLYQPDHLVEHRWRVGDLVIWDNLSLQHGRPAMPTAAARTHRRVVIGRRGVVEQVPGFRPSFLETG